MKIVQTFWSGGTKNPASNNYGWKESKYHLLSWTLSAQQLLKFYPQVELYTDKAGYHLLIEKLKLPYSDVHVVMDRLNIYDPDLWALPKILTYSLQNTPFLHIDGDVFIWSKFPKELTDSSLIAQNEEIETHYYRNMLSAILQGLTYIPSILEPYFKNVGNMRMFNMGIAGGNDCDFFKEYATKAFDFVDKNSNSLKTISKFNFNIFFEQLLFYALANKKGIDVGCLFSGITEDQSYKGFGDFDSVPKEKTYLHLLGTYKRNEFICKKLETEVLLQYPEQFYRLQKLLPKDFSSIPKKTSICGFIKQPLEAQSRTIFSESRIEKNKTDSEILIKRDLFNRAVTLKPEILDNPKTLFYRFSGYQEQYVPKKEDIIPTGINNVYSVSALKDVNIIKIPEYDGRISEQIIDDIDIIILKELIIPRTFSELFLQMEKYLEDNEEEFLSEFRQLIRNRIKKLLAQRSISLKISCTTRVEVEKPLIE